MKIERYFLVVGFMMVCLCGYSQASEILVDWGPIRKNKELNFNHIIGTHGQLFYTISTADQSIFEKNSARDYVVTGIDLKTKQVEFRRTLEDFSFGGEKAIYQQSFVKPNGNVVLYFEVFDAKADKKRLIYREMDPSGKFGPSKVLASMHTDRRKNGHFKLLVSRDSSLMAIYSDIPAESRENEEFVVKVTNRNHELIWERSIVLPYTSKYFSIIDHAVTNRGEVFILGYSVPDKTKGEKKERQSSNQDFKLFRLNGSEQVEEFDLNLDDKYVSDASIQTDYFKDLVAIPGFYSDERASGMNGSFFFTLNQTTLEVETYSYQPFTKDLLLNFMSEKKVDRGREIGNFEFKDFIVREDGGAVVVAENEYIIVTESNINGMYSRTVTYYNNDLIVISINPDGTISWSTVVPKRQALSGPFYLSYLLMIDGDQLQFVYNDDSRNMQRYGTGDKLKFMNNVSKSVATIATVSSTGEVSHDRLFFNKGYSALLVPKKSFQFSQNAVILYAERKNDSRFGTMHIR